MKKCSKCGEVKLPDGFYKRKIAKDGLVSACKTCMALAKKAYLKANPEKAKAAWVIWYKENSEKLRARWVAYRKANPEECRAKDTAHRRANPEKYKEKSIRKYRANPEKYKEKSIRYYWANHEKSNTRTKKWRQANAEKVKALKAEYIKSMPDSFLKELIYKSSGLSKEQISQEMVEVKRAHLKLARKLKEMTT